jgi:PAS domain S-box-containing protein
MIGTQANSAAAFTASPRGRRWLIVVSVVAVALLVIQALADTTQLGSATTDQALADWTYRALMFGAALTVVARAIINPRDRLAWGLIGAGLTAWAIGDVYYFLAFADGRKIPYPSPSDALYLVDYIALIAGVRLLGGRNVGAGAFSFGLVVALLGLATVWSWVVFGEVMGAATGGTAAVATTLAYPLLDLFLLTSTLVALAARQWRFDRVFIALLLGFALSVVADSVLAVRVADGTYADGTIIDALWPAGAVAIAAAAWLRPARVRERSPSTDGLVPAVASAAVAVAITALVWDHFWRLDTVTIALSGLTLAAGCAQLFLLYRARKEALTRAIRSESLRSASTQAALDCIISTDAEGRVREWNAAASRTFGYQFDEVLGRDLGDLIIPPALRKGHKDGWARMIETGGAAVLDRRIETIGMHAGGAEFPIEVAVTRVSDDPPMFTGFIRDISDRKTREAENERLAAIVRSSDDAIISKDLSGAVTAWNHGAETLYGYSALEAIGQPLEQLIVPGGHDENLDTVLDRISSGKTAASEVERNRKNGERLSVSLRSFAVRDQAGEIVGISSVAHDITDRKSREKRDLEDREESLWRGRIEAALDQDRFVFFGQPIVDLRTGIVDHQELLIRMELDGEIISPGAFLPHAEKTGLITRIDRWAIRHGIEFARSSRVAINLSGKSLDDADLGYWIGTALADRDVAKNLTFEITETAAASNLDAAERLVVQLTELGCGVALDDFGTGFGSFTYLSRLPVTELKIDMEFVRGLTEDPQSQRAVKSIVSAASLFNLTTVAEGVEDEATLELLRGLGVDKVQGFFVGYPSRVSPRPLTPAEIEVMTSAEPERKPRERTDDHELELVRTLFEAVASGDPATVIAVVDPEIEWTPTAWSGAAVRGHNGVREWMLRFGTGLTQLDTELQTLERHGDQILALGTVIDSRGEQTFAVRVGWVFSFRNGLIVRGRAYPDWATTRAAVGPAPESAALAPAI